MSFRNAEEFQLVHTDRVNSFWLNNHGKDHTSFHYYLRRMSHYVSLGSFSYFLDADVNCQLTSPNMMKQNKLDPKLGRV